MAQKVTIELIDDLDGGKAEETVAFALDNKTYAIDLNKKNADKFRKAFQPYIDKARSAGRSHAPAPRQRSTGRKSDGKSKTLFSGLSAEEKDSFRAWSGMHNARRIGDNRVQDWIDAGRP